MIFSSKRKSTAMSSLEYDEELAKLSVPQLVWRISQLTAEYTASIERITYEILIRAMQEAE